MEMVPVFNSQSLSPKRPDCLKFLKQRHQLEKKVFSYVSPWGTLIQTTTALNLTQMLHTCYITIYNCYTHLQK